VDPLDGSLGDLLAPIVADLSTALVALDFDGTLAVVVDHPDDAVALPEAAAAVHALAPHVACLAVITGRPALFVVDQLRLTADQQRVVVLGGYGRERWARGEYTGPPPPAAVRAALPELQALVAGAPDGTWLEDKGAGIAVHARQTADPAAVLAVLEADIRVLARRHGLIVEPGRMVLELRAPGIDKGEALLGLAAEVRPRAVLFAGDDLGDLAAFATVDELRRQGMGGVTVCSGSDEVPELAARADLVVDGPAGVAALLNRLVRRAGN
jgi:trehalose 6-phosphate phosphatase